VRIPKGFTTANTDSQAGSKSRQDDDVIDV
jgi:hypothetical protein